MSEAFAAGAHGHRLLLPPLPADSERPLWSVIIPTHNCAAYVETTLASVLAQAPAAEEMQIEVIDDHSEKDDPEAVVRRLGPGRVGFFDSPRTLVTSATLRRVSNDRAAGCSTFSTATIRCFQGFMPV